VNSQALLRASLLAFFTLLCIRTNAQVSAGALGTVAIESGTGILNARVTLKNAATEVSRAITTKCRRLLHLPHLEPETYEMTVQASVYYPSANAFV